ncbi:hydantoinase B/oxoprolinase family protein [Bacillus sp. DTU_2020_1000418_1_SI_GHA_SEK_038]|uniref:hydantoinase B/oxoprolinase family protein n=1 Tax=Bacillus sp. DTU_2020_1000418_1_SI_GHA_SEK_038 TaxID=3077585 RepID=UPI0028EB537A|nr:hydantoinase B/oxoprolinase family protein [Bacillus sp. DTU_2020_1000418_1_SI_GHA_SEK_038]WNS74740.1 hydantoinase B/oxoprolinase family protein [Bacillus sp. DTU_2020_1000418_1_SI_GHA_SEK_038]
MSTQQQVYLENPVTTEIVRNALISAADEMNASLARSAFSPIIYEMKDCSVCIFNRDVELLGQSAGLPIFLGNIDECIKVTTNVIGGIERYKDGDVYILNDSYIGGTHLNDVTVFSPIFFEGELVGFTANRAHWLDIGSKDPGYPMDATSIYQEGIRIPPTKIYDNGKPIEDVIRLIVSNNRFREAALGDLNAQIAACRTGEKRFKELIVRFGIDRINRCIHDIFKQSEEMDRSVIRNIPDGEYEAEGYLDNDGVKDEPILVKVKVTVKGEYITIDLTGSSKQRFGQTNCGYAQTISACRVAFKDLISPSSPVTGGNFRTMNVIAPEATIFHAVEPAPCGWYFTPLGLLIDLIIKALSPVMKDKAAGAHYGDSMVVTFAGIDERTSESFLSVEATAGGWGAFHNGDGQSALINHVSGDFKNLPIEVFESKYPIRINQYALRQNSGGAGQYRGGLGVVREYEILSEDTTVSLWFERSKTPAWGLFGGQPGMKPDVEITSDGQVEHLLKVNGRKIRKGDIVKVMTGGGGGFGEPSERAAKDKENDKKNQYVTAE